MAQKRIWLSWETQRRTIELSGRLNCLLKIFEYKGCFRYPKAISKTILYFYREKPDIIFVQNPSMVLTALACIYCNLLKTPLVVDRHTTFLLDKPFSNYFKRKIFLLLHSFTIKYATLTIVTNTHLAELVIKSGGRPYVLPDPLPSMKQSKKDNNSGLFSVLVPCSFNHDEPLDQIINASQLLLDKGFQFYITGNSKRIPLHIKKLSLNNVIFTGFLPDLEYIDLLFSVDGVLVLTTATSTMLCGCYEAVAAEKPLITTNKPCLTEYFTEASFVDNSPQQIANACQAIKKNTQQVIDKTKKMKEVLTHSWADRLKKLETILGDITK